MTTMSTEDYLVLVEQAYQNRGGIDFQREKLRTNPPNLAIKLCMRRKDEA